MSNPLLSDRDVDFLLYEVERVDDLTRFAAFSEHGRDVFDMYLREARRLARDVLFPAYKAMDADPARLEAGRVRVHPSMRAIWPQLAGLGVLTATRPPDVGGAQLPHVVAAAAHAYLMAGNANAFGFAGLTSGAARLIESFGDPRLKSAFMAKMYAGEWTGTMALTEPHAGSSLADVKTVATPADDGTYRLRGAKIFISGGDHDFGPNVVHLVLARIAGAPPGIKGVSLFAVPNFRPAAGLDDDGPGADLVPNDVHVAGLVHKIGWKGLPSLVISFGEADDCRGWLVGEAHRGIPQMFQMMNEARLMVGLNGVATAYVAYQEALEYARTRMQGRPAGARDPASPQVPIIRHADVRRMLLRQKMIVEGALGLALHVARLVDVSEHAETEDERRRARLLVDFLTPIAKSFPAERGFEANVLAVQIHGGYGYSSEYLVESWMRDQKLNSLHEGTTGIQALDLLGRKTMSDGGAVVGVLVAEIEAARARAREVGLDDVACGRLQGAVSALLETIAHLGALGAAGEIERMLAHATTYLDLASIVVVGWEWLRQATAARAALDRATTPEAAAFYRGKIAAWQAWSEMELPRVGALAAACKTRNPAYFTVDDAEL